MLEARHIRYRYNAARPWILDNINLKINRGERVGLYGHSGQGKSTLARILGGYLSPTAGQVKVDGQVLPPKGYCPVQMIFQHPETALNPRWRIADSLAEAGPVSEDVLRQFHIETAWLERKPFELSGGELQRVAIARVLRPETRYLLADEMTAMLDALSQAQIWQLLLAFARQHELGVLVISHDRRLLEIVCHRVVPMEGISGG